MIPLQSLSHHIEGNFWITSIAWMNTYNLQVNTKEKMDPCPGLDILIIPNKDGSLSTTVYRKPTNTDLYLQRDSHHTIPSKYTVIGTLYHIAQTICSNPKLLQQEGRSSI